jgi:hypothetical protein
MLTPPWCPLLTLAAWPLLAPWPARVARAKPLLRVRAGNARPPATQVISHLRHSQQCPGAEANRPPSHLRPPLPSPDNSSHHGVLAGRAPCVAPDPRWLGRAHPSPVRLPRAQ